MTLYFILTFLLLLVGALGFVSMVRNLTDHHGAQIAGAIVAALSFCAWFWMTVGFVVAHFLKK